MGKIYLKLGEKADSFYDPTLKIDLNSKDKVVEVDNIAPQASKMLKEALAGKHVEKVSVEEYKDYLAKKEEAEASKETKKKKKPTPPPPPEDDEDEEEETGEDPDDEEAPEDMTNLELKNALEDSSKLTEEERKSLSKMKKEELVALYYKYIKDEE